MSLDPGLWLFREYLETAEERQLDGICKRVHSTGQSFRSIYRQIAVDRLNQQGFEAGPIVVALLKLDCYKKIIVMKRDLRYYRKIV